MSEPITMSEVYSDIKSEILEEIRVFLDKQKMPLTVDQQKHFVIPYIERFGFDSWSKIYCEVELMTKKQSNQSKTVREHLATLYYNVYNKMIELNKKQ